MDPIRTRNAPFLVKIGSKPGQSQVHIRFAGRGAEGVRPGGAGLAGTARKVLKLSMENQKTCSKDLGLQNPGPS